MTERRDDDQGKARDEPGGGSGWDGEQHDARVCVTGTEAVVCVLWWEGFGGDGGDRGGSSAEPNAEADVLGPESKERTSAAVLVFLAWDDILWDMDVLWLLMVLLLKEYRDGRFRWAATK